MDQTNGTFHNANRGWLTQEIQEIFKTEVIIILMVVLIQQMTSLDVL